MLVLALSLSLSLSLLLMLMLLLLLRLLLLLLLRLLLLLLLLPFLFFVGELGTTYLETRLASPSHPRCAYDNEKKPKLLQMNTASVGCLTPFLRVSP